MEATDQGIQRKSHINNYPFLIIFFCVNWVISTIGVVNIIL